MGLGFWALPLEMTLIDSHLADFSISASASLHPPSSYTSSYQSSVSIVFSYQSSVSIVFSGISPFNYFHFSWFRSAVPFHVSTAFSFMLHFHFVSAFSTGVSGWFSRFSHLGLDDKERERERERSRY